MGPVTASEPIEKQFADMAKRLADILALVAEETRSCRRCPMTLYFVRHRNGHLAPYTIDGVNHFINCPAAKDFRKPKGGPR